MRVNKTTIRQILSLFVNLSRSDSYLAQMSLFLELLTILEELRYLGLEAEIVKGFHLQQYH